MKIEGLFLIGIGIFFGIVGAVYWFMAPGMKPDDSGTMMLIGTCTLGLLPGLYYFYWNRRFHGKKYMFFGKLETKVGDRPEDRPDAEIEDGAGIIATFPGSSIWPFILGMGAFSACLSLVFGVWILTIAVTLIVMALTGATAESRRGGHV